MRSRVGQIVLPGEMTIGRIDNHNLLIAAERLLQLPDLVAHQPLDSPPLRQAGPDEQQHSRCVRGHRRKPEYQVTRGGQQLFSVGAVVFQDFLPSEHGS